MIISSRQHDHVFTTDTAGIGYLVVSLRLFISLTESFVHPNLPVLIHLRHKYALLYFLNLGIDRFLELDAVNIKQSGGSDARLIVRRLKASLEFFRAM